MASSSFQGYFYSAVTINGKTTKVEKKFTDEKKFVEFVKGQNSKPKLVSKAKAVPAKKVAAKMPVKKVAPKKVAKPVAKKAPMKKPVKSVSKKK